MSPGTENLEQVWPHSAPDCLQTQSPTHLLPEVTLVPVYCTEHTLCTIQRRQLPRCSHTCLTYSAGSQHLLNLNPPNPQATREHPLTSNTLGLNISPCQILSREICGGRRVVRTGAQCLAFRRPKVCVPAPEGVGQRGA